MFVEVKERIYKDKLVLNTDNIVYIHEGCGSILVNAVECDGSSKMLLTKESVDKLLKLIKPL